MYIHRYKHSLDIDILSYTLFWFECEHLCLNMFIHTDMYIESHRDTHNTLKILNYIQQFNFPRYHFFPKE